MATYANKAISIAVAARRQMRAGRFGANRQERRKKIANSGAIRILRGASADQKRRGEPAPNACGATPARTRRGTGGCRRSRTLHRSLPVRPVRRGDVDARDQEGDRQCGDIADCDEARFGGWSHADCKLIPPESTTRGETRPAGPIVRIVSVQSWQRSAAR